MPVSRKLLAALGLSGACLAAAALACGGSTSSSTRTITGIIVRSETMTTGRGCGIGPSQVYKVAAVVFGKNPGGPAFDQPLTSNVYDCFADGAFIDLPPVGGSFTYRLELYVYSQPAFAPAAQEIYGAGVDTERLRKTLPTWTTTCFATQEPDVQALAVCDPLAVGLGGIGGTTQGTAIRVETKSFALEDGGGAACVAPGDAGAGDADAGDADDGGDGGAPSPGTGFSAVRVTPSVRGATGTAITKACPEPIVIEPALPLEPYTLDVEALGADLVTVRGRTTCTAIAQPGLTSLAACERMR